MDSRMGVSNNFVYGCIRLSGAVRYVEAVAAGCRVAM